MSKTAFTFILICCSLTVPSLRRAQNHAIVKGNVVDSSGSVVANAVVTLTNLTTGKATSSTTGADGQFVFNDVLPGPQIVSVEKSGFASFSRRVSITAGQSTNITATLQVATLAESVVIRGTVNPEAKPVPSREDVMVTPETLRVLDRKQIEAADPRRAAHKWCRLHPAPMWWATAKQVRRNTAFC